jgi:capsular polysaccharide biosynthesis protein
MQKDFNWILVSGSLPVQAEFVEILKKMFCLAAKCKIIIVSGYETYKCSNLFVPSMPDRCFNEEFYDENRPSIETIRKIRDFVSSIPLRKDVRKVEKIYISRKNAASRKLHNEAQVETDLSAMGFSLVELEKMKLSEQIQIFQGAKCIIAAHGSGLSNLVFCGEGTRVIEIFPHDYIKPMYAFIAMHLNLDYRPIISEKNIGFDRNSVFQISFQSIRDTLKQ